MSAQPAFPLHPGINPDVGDGIYTGMTLRDWFAGQAVVGLTQRRITKNEAISLDGEAYALLSYRIADAMLAARKTGGDA